MRDTYSRGNVTLTVDRPAGSDTVTFTISRAAPLTTDEVRRVNAELADYPSARGAALAHHAAVGRWEVRGGEGAVLAHDGGDESVQLSWTALA